MAPDVNWEMVDSIAKGTLTEANEDSMEQVVNFLRDLNEAEYREDAEKLVLLLQSAKKILDYREAAVTDILQEQEERLEEKEEEINALRKNLDEEQKLVPRDAEFYRIENRRLLEQKDSYMQQNEDLSREIAQAIEERNKFEQEAEDMRKLNRELKAEVQEMKLNLHEYQNIMDKQNEMKMSEGDPEMRMKLNERNQQISDLLTQITQLEEVNRTLESSTKKLKQEMESGQEEMEKMADEYEKMKKVIGASDHFTDDLHRKNARLNMQVADLRQQLDAKSREDDAITQAVNEKVEEWNKRLKEKDEETAEQARVIAVMQEKLASATVGQDKREIEKLTKKLQESEYEVSQLKKGLNQAVIDLEEQTAIVEDLRRDKGTNREIIRYKKQIRDLQSDLLKQEAAVRDAESQRSQAESDAHDNDLKLTEALKRITMLESGQYGLTEAVNEIKECKNAIRGRDQEIRNMTIVTNQLEDKLNDFLEENEEYRERLGIDPRNMDDIIALRKSRVLRQQQFRAENQVLLKEIETLEEERISLKKQIRRQAKSQTQKAADDGLDPDDVELVDEFIDDLVRMRKQGILDKLTARSFFHNRPSETKPSVSKETLNRNVENLQRKVDAEMFENNRLKEENEAMKSENQDLQAAMKAIHNELKRPRSATRVASDIIRIPSLERLVSLTESRKSGLSGRSSSHLKSEVDQLTGRNDELRSELRNLRNEHDTLMTENSTLNIQVKELKSELDVMNKITESGQRVTMATMNLPKDPSSDDVITALNEQLVQVLDGNDKKGKSLSEVKEALENTRRQLQVVRHQTHLLYKENHSESEKWSSERKSWQDEKEKLQEKLDRNEVKLDEYERLLSALQSDPDEAKRKMAETSRKVSLLRANEKTLIRRHRALESSEELLSTENIRLKKEISQIEKAVSERISYLERYKAMSAFKLESMQKAMEGSVPEADLSTLNRRFDELTSKYRDLLQKENQFVARNVKIESLQEELKIMMEKSDALRDELSIEKERRHTVEEAMRRSNISTLETSSSFDKEAMTALKKVTVLEMKELNERQKAEHATRMYNQLKKSLDEMQNRNSELEEKFSQLTRLNLAAQQTERELRDELAEVVPRSVSEADRRKLARLEEELAKGKIKMSKVQDMADISHNQLQSVQSQQQARDRELVSLRQQLREFQVQTDQHALIGKLHHQILNLQASEVDTQRKLEITQKNVSKLEAHVLRLEKQLDEKDDSIYLIRSEGNNKIRQLKKTVQSLRQQFSGALPLVQQEKFSQAMIRLHEDKALIQQELRRVRVERERLEDKLAEAQVKEEGLMELRKAIEDQRGADKLTEWSRRMDKLRLQDMKLQRQVVRQGEHIKYIENLNGQHEKTISSLEEDIVQLLKAQEEHQVEWEMREMELERLLDQFQSQQREVTKKAKRLEDVTILLPDPSLPIDVQLNSALHTIKEQTKTIKDLQGQMKAREYENERLKDVRHNLESDVTSRDRIINELRLHMPTTKTVTNIAANMDSEPKQQLRVAMETIESLKKRLAAKEESLIRYKQLLEESKKEQEAIASSHERELLMMQKRLHEKTDEHFNKFRKPGVISSSPRTGASSDLIRINELEEMVKEQDAAMSALMDRVRAANADVTKQKSIIAETRRNADAEKSRLIQEQESFLNAIKLKLAKKQQRVEVLEKELLILKEELQRQKNRSPAATMKNLVERLKQQLEEKEKQQQKLSHALTELRADLVHQAQENVRAHAAEESDGRNVKVLVDRRTTQYKIQIEELKDRMAELQRAVKQAKKTEETLHVELKKVVEESEKKGFTINKLKMDLRGKDTDINQLREKVKRLVRSRGTEAGWKFEEEPTKLKRESSTDSEKQELVTEELVAPMEAGAEETPRPSSGRSSKLPRSKSSSLTDVEKINKLRSDIYQLKEENENLKEKLKLKTEEPTKSTLEVAKWDAKKQWQNKVEQIKSKLQEKEKQVELYEKQTKNLRDTISRLEREKLRRAAAPIGPPIHAQGTLEESVPPSDHAVRQHLHKIEDLSRRLHQLGEENSQLRKLNVLPHQKMAVEMEAKNKQLSNQLDDLQKEILTSGLRQSRDETLSEQFKSRENALQGRILKLSSDNTQLMFEIEQIKLDVPRLQERLEYQQRYIDLLQSEKREALTKLERMKAVQAKPSVGTSGKSTVELEKTIALMKKVVERVQRENDQLKKAPGVVSNKQLEEMKSENQLLKNRIHEMTQQIGGQLSMRYEAKTQSVDRLIKENDRLRKELDRQVSAKDKMRESKMAFESDKDKLMKQVDDLKKRLSVAESKAPKITGAGSKGYNSAVTSRMLESKLKKSEEDLKKQRSENNTLKLMLEEKSAAENELVKDNERLHEQVEILERFPPGAGGADPDTVRELQIARLSIARLEHEMEELKHETDRLRRRHSDETVPKITDDEGYEKTSIRADNLRLETEVRMLKEDKKKMAAEAQKMQEELAHFDADFFDEIEDLKYNFSEAVKKNVLYEEQLRMLSKQFGVAVDIPSGEV